MNLCCFSISIIVVEEWTKREIVPDKGKLFHNFPSILTLIAGKRKDRSIVGIFLRDDKEKADILHYLQDICKVSFDVEFYHSDVSERRQEEVESLEEIKHKKKINLLSNVEKHTMGNMRKLIQKHEDILLASYSNLVGIGVSRIVDGSRCGKPCIVLHCLNETIVPFGENMLPKFIEGYPVEVKENLYTFAIEHCKTCPPIDYNCSIGNQLPDPTKNTAGSVGFFVKNTEKVQEGGFLTAAHIALCEEQLNHIHETNALFTRTEGDMNFKIVHPSLIDSNMFDVIGNVHNAFFGNLDTVGNDTAYVQFPTKIQRGNSRF